MMLKSDLPKAIDATRRVFNHCAHNTMIQVCIANSTPYTIKDFMHWLNKKEFKKEMFWVFISLQTFSLLRNKKQIVQVTTFSPDSSGLDLFIFSKTEYGFAGVCFIITRLVKSDNIYLLDNLPGQPQ